MAALLGIDSEQEFAAGILDALTPKTILRLDVVADRILELGRTDEAVRALRAAPDQAGFLRADKDRAHGRNNKTIPAQKSR